MAGQKRIGEARQWRRPPTATHDDGQEECTSGSATAAAPPTAGRGHGLEQYKNG